MYDCGDTDGNGITDDNCRWCDCNGGYCVVFPRIFADKIEITSVVPAVVVVGDRSARTIP